MSDEDAGLTGLCANSAMDLIGSTPLVRLSKLSPEKGATVWAKAELLNCSGSVKDRPARAMIVAAEAQGALKPGAVIVEATSGNTELTIHIDQGVPSELLGDRSRLRQILVNVDRVFDVG